jgi:NAD kinase
VASGAVQRAIVGGGDGIVVGAHRIAGDQDVFRISLGLAREGQPSFV